MSENQQPYPATDDPLLSIGVFSRRSRLSARALRLYDRLGLLVPAQVDDDSGYRRYRSSQLAAARLIVMLRRLDMPLAQVAAVLAGPPDVSDALVAGHAAGIERRAASQRELATYIRAQLLGAHPRVLGDRQAEVHEEKEPVMRYEIKERDVPEQTFLTRARNVTVSELRAFIDETVPALMTLADRYGAATGPCTFVYHGQVDEDSDGPVELCVPVDPQIAAKAGLTTRVEPAHREGYVRLIKAQVEFPQILSAYDAVLAWAHARGNGHGAPREVYLGDFLAAAPDDEICDVAIPIGS